MALHGIGGATCPFAFEELLSAVVRDGGLPRVFEVEDGLGVVIAADVEGHGDILDWKRSPGAWMGRTLHRILAFPAVPL